MIFKDEQSKSLLPKVVFISAISLITIIAGYLMIVDKNSLPIIFQKYSIEGNILRQFLLMFCLFFYVVRLSVTVFVFLKRKMVWSEMILVTVLISFVLYSFAKIGGNNFQSIGILDLVGILFYLVGSWINTSSEYSRHIWKREIANKGKLYTVGLFKHSMHINYFGDVLLFSGFALITQNLTLLIIPLAMLLNFIFFIIPTLDKYLAKKYGHEFIEYSERTKKLIPGLY